MFPLRDTIPSRHTPVMTWAIIALNLGVFVYQLTLSEPELQRVFYLSGVVPARYTDREWATHVGYVGFALWPFLTSMFLHGGWLHILSNMWSLWIFGDNVEDRLGPVRYLIFYLLCGVLAGLVHFFTNLTSTVPTLGASGAIAGVMGAYFVLFPHARVVTIIPIFFWPMFVQVPAILYLGFWFLTQFFSGAMSLGASDAGGIAWWAHIGGFAAGIGLLRVFGRRRPDFYSE
jgi:membrane associated rhomboid family serine protease